MRSTTVLLAAALLVSAAPLGATAAGHQSNAAARAAWLARREALTKPLNLDEDYVAATRQAAESNAEDYAFLLKAGDLDGDGGSDVVDLRDHVVYDKAAGNITETIRLEAHRGRDGAPLWTIAPPPGGDLIPLFVPTGAGGKAGVVVLSYSGQGVDGVVAGAGQADTTITSYDGAGKQLWTSTFHGAGAGSIQGWAEGFTDLAGMFDAVPGGGTDLLLTTQADSLVADPTWTAAAYAVGARYTILDGATGVQHDLGTPVVAPMGGAHPFVVGDLDGDRRDDVVISSQINDVPTLTAIRSTDGKTLWTLAGTAAASWEVAALGDATGDGKDDVAVAGYAYDTDAETVALLDGTTGRARWTKAGSSAYDLGDADHKRGDEVAVVSPVDGRSAFGVTAQAYNASGKRLWSATRTVRTSDLQGGAYSVQWGAIGDTDVDGVQELGYLVSVTPFGANSRRDSGTIDGRTGRVLLDPVTEMYATPVALDGHGGDAYTRTVAHGVLTVTAWRGDRPAKLWSVALPVKAASPNGSFGTYAERGRCGDLAVSVTDDATFTSVMLSGRTGRPLWALVRTGNGAAKVTHPAVRSAERYAPTC